MLGEVRGKHWGLGRRNLAAAAGMFGINETHFIETLLLLQIINDNDAHTPRPHTEQATTQNIKTKIISTTQCHNAPPPNKDQY